MIAGPALAKWLADRDAQRRSYQAVDACAQRWSVQPLMTQLERELTELPERNSVNVLAAARRFLDRTDEISAMMDEMIAGSRAEPFFRPPFHPLSSDIHNSLLLYHHPDLSIGLGVTGVDMLAAKKSGKRGATSINFTGLVTVMRFVKAGNATLSFWEMPAITDRFVASEAGNCRFAERRRIDDGEEMVIDGRHQSFVIEHAETDIVFFQATIRAGAAPLAVEYDSRSLAFIGASSTDEASSRVQMMVSLLRTMDREDALPLIEESLATPHFYARWHIMRELLAMDAEAALPPLRRMAASDPHPEVRAAAQQTLDLFFEDEAAPAPQGGLTCRA